MDKKVVSLSALMFSVELMKTCLHHFDKASAGVQEGQQMKVGNAVQVRCCAKVICHLVFLYAVLDKWEIGAADY